MELISKLPRAPHRLQREARRAWHRGRMAWRYANYALQNPRPWAYPDRMYLESTNACNLRCIMCPTGCGLAQRKKGFLDYDLFRQIVDEMAPHVSMTTLHIWGEPLLHPRIVDMIAYCNAHGLHAEISTNAVLLTPEISQAILDAGLGAIYLCLDGTTPETYEQVRREASFEQTTEHIKRFLELRTRGGYEKLLTKLQIIELAPTVAQIEAFKQAWAIPGVDQINVKAFDSWGDQVADISSLRAEQGPQLPARFHCPNLWYHVHIYWDGTLVCCDRDFDALYPLGNVRDGVMKAWLGPDMTRLRMKHLNHDLDDVPSCGRCVEWAWWRPTWSSAQGNRPASTGEPADASGSSA
ncbi:MAG: radical SAM protein [Anaerolineae bacterium]|nr:radical SAM protein [Anaerolineae bacterium]